MTKNYYIFLFFIALFNFLGLNFLLQMLSQTNICNDSLNYIEAAQLLYYHFETHQYRPILISSIVGLPLLFSDSIEGILIFGLLINLICWFGTAFLIFKILKKIIAERYAFFIASIFLFLIGNLALVFQLLTETIFTFIVVLAFYFYIKFREKNEYKFLSYFITLFVLSMLIKPSSLFFGLFLLLFFSKQIVNNYQSKSTILLILSVFFVVVQCVGNYSKYGDFKISYIDSITYYNYLGTKADYLKSNKELVDFGTNYRNKYIFSLKPTEANKVAMQDFKTQLTTNFYNFCKAYLYDLRYNATGGSSTLKFAENIKQKDYFSASQSFLFQVSKIQNVLFTLVGFILSIFSIARFKKEKSEFVLISLFIIYTILLSGVSMAQGDRFHVVIFPFVLILFSLKLQSDENKK